MAFFLEGLFIAIDGSRPLKPDDSSTIAYLVKIPNTELQFIFPEIL
jgi:hypothetical protein